MFITKVTIVMGTQHRSSTGMVVEWREVNSLSHVWLFANPWTVAHQAPLSMEFSRQEYWSGLPFPSPYEFNSYINAFKMLQVKVDYILHNNSFFLRIRVQFSSVQFSHSVIANSLRPPGLQHARPPCPSPTPRVYSNSYPSESVMPSNHLILCHPLFLLPSDIPNIRVFSNESILCSRWPEYWSFSFSISPSSDKN